MEKVFSLYHILLIMIDGEIVYYTRAAIGIIVTAASDSGQRAEPNLVDSDQITLWCCLRQVRTVTCGQPSYIHCFDTETMDVGIIWIT